MGECVPPLHDGSPFVHCCFGCDCMCAVIHMCADPGIQVGVRGFMCLHVCGAQCGKSLSSCLQRVPMGSRASRTKQRTSAASTTFEPPSRYAFNYAFNCLAQTCLPFLVELGPDSSRGTLVENLLAEVATSRFLLLLMPISIDEGTVVAVAPFFVVAFRPFLCSLTATLDRQRGQEQTCADGVCLSSRSPSRSVAPIFARFCWCFLLKT